MEKVKTIDLPKSTRGLLMQAATNPNVGDKLVQQVLGALTAYGEIAMDGDFDPAKDQIQLVAATLRVSRRSEDIEKAEASNGKAKEQVVV